MTKLYVYKGRMIFQNKKNNNLVIMNFTKKDEHTPFIVLISTVTGTSVCLSQPIISTSAGGTCGSFPGVF